MNLVALRLLAPVVAPTGGHWNAGEVASFVPDVAAGLIARGLAQVPKKAAPAPPADTMLRGAPVKK